MDPAAGKFFQRARELGQGAGNKKRRPASAGLL